MQQLDSETTERVTNRYSGTKNLFCCIFLLPSSSFFFFYSLVIAVLMHFWVVAYAAFGGTSQEVLSTVFSMTYMCNLRPLCLPKKPEQFLVLTAMS